MKHHGNRNIDLSQPLRNQKDKSNKSDRKTTRVGTATPEFDRTAHKTPAGVSPIKKDLLQNKSNHLLAEDRGRPLVTQLKYQDNHYVRPGLGGPKASERDHPQIAAVKKIADSHFVKENHESSFEQEEKRIKKENHTKDLLALLIRIAENSAQEEGKELIDNLKKQSKIYEVQMEYATQQRNNNLKVSFLKNLLIASKKYNYHMRLVKNFARIFNRPVKIHASATLEQAFNQIKQLKVALFKPHAHGRKTSRTATGPTHHRSNTASNVQEISKQIPMDTFGAANNTQISTQTKKNENIKASKPKIKIDESKAERVQAKTPTKESFGRKAEPSKDIPKQKEVPKKPEPKQEIQPVKSKELPSKKSKAQVLIKPYSVSSSRDDLALSPSRVRQSVAASEMKDSSVQKMNTISSKKQNGQSAKVNIVDNSNSIMDKHMELKRKLLKQIRGEDGTDTEDLEDSTPKTLVGRPHTVDSNHKELGNLNLMKQLQKQSLS